MNVHESSTMFVAYRSHTSEPNVIIGTTSVSNSCILAYNLAFSSRKIRLRACIALFNKIFLSKMKTSVFVKNNFKVIVLSCGLHIVNTLQV